MPPTLNSRPRLSSLANKYEIEAESRRNNSETYLLPIKHSSEEEEQDLEEFLIHFHRTIYNRRDEIKRLLSDYPDSLGKYYRLFVKQEKTVSCEDFWQRYFYKCDKVRIAKNWSNNNNNNNNNGSPKAKSSAKIDASDSIIDTISNKKSTTNIPPEASSRGTVDRVSENSSTGELAILNQNESSPRSVMLPLIAFHGYYNQEIESQNQKVLMPRSYSNCKPRCLLAQKHTEPSVEEPICLKERVKYKPDKKVFENTKEGAVLKETENVECCDSADEGIEPSKDKSHLVLSNEKEKDYRINKGIKVAQTQEVVKKGAFPTKKVLINKRGSTINTLESLPATKAKLKEKEKLVLNEALPPKVGTPEKGTQVGCETTDQKESHPVGPKLVVHDPSEEGFQKIFSELAISAKAVGEVPISKRKSTRVALQREAMEATSAKNADQVEAKQTEVKEEVSGAGVGENVFRNRSIDAHGECSIETRAWSKETMTAAHNISNTKDTVTHAHVKEGLIIILMLGLLSASLSFFLTSSRASNYLDYSFWKVRRGFLIVDNDDQGTETGSLNRSIGLLATLDSSTYSLAASLENPPQYSPYDYCRHHDDIVGDFCHDDGGSGQSFRDDNSGSKKDDDAGGNNDIPSHDNLLERESSNEMLPLSDKYHRYDIDDEEEDDLWLSSHDVKSGLGNRCSSGSSYSVDDLHNESCSGSIQGSNKDDDNDDKDDDEKHSAVYEGNFDSVPFHNIEKPTPFEGTSSIIDSGRNRNLCEPSPLEVASTGLRDLTSSESVRTLVKQPNDVFVPLDAEMPCNGKFMNNSKEHKPETFVRFKKRMLSVLLPVVQHLLREANTIDAQLFFQKLFPR